MITMKDIAEYSQVSLATVSRVINGSSNVSIEKRKHVMEWVQKLDYHPNISARGLTGSASFLIGIMFPDLSNPFFIEILSQVEEEASHLGYSVLISNTHGYKNKIRETINIYKARQVDGVLLCIDSRETSLMQYVLQKGIPAVSFTQPSPLIDSIFTPMEKGGALVAQHFLDLGHEKIAYIGEKDGSKFTGFLRYLNQNGVDIAKENIIEIDSWGNLSSGDIISRIRNFAASRKNEVSAIFAFNDITAIQVMQSFKDVGVSIPEDIALAGFDNIFLSREISPSLTTVAQPTKEIGRLAVETLIRRINQKTKEPPEMISLKPRLIVRESTRGCK